MTIGRGMKKESGHAPTLSTNRRRMYSPPPIPLERPERKTLTKQDGPTFRLRTQPENEHSPTYELQVPVFRSGTPEEWLLTKKKLLQAHT